MAAESVAYALALDGLHLFDLTVPTEPIEVGRYQQLSRASQVVLRGRHVFVLEGQPLSNTSSWGALYAFDVADPSNPQPVGSIRLNRPRVLAVGDRFAVVGLDGPDPSQPQQGAIGVVDLIDPAHPSVVSTMATDLPWQIVLNGNVAFMTSPVGSIIALDVADPSHPREVGQIRRPYVRELTSDQPWQGIAVQDPYLYVAANDRPSATTGGSFEGKLPVFDASNPSNLVQIASVPSSLNGDSIVVHGRYAFAGGTQLRVFDLIDPRLPVELGRFDGGFEGPP